mgnify:CR=1 FL=1
MSFPECDTFEVGSRKWLICRNEAGLSTSKTNGYRVKWGMTPIEIPVESPAIASPAVSEFISHGHSVSESNTFPANKIYGAGSEFLIRISASGVEITEPLRVSAQAMNNLGAADCRISLNDIAVDLAYHLAMDVDQIKEHLTAAITACGKVISDRISNGLNIHTGERVRGCSSCGGGQPREGAQSRGVVRKDLTEQRERRRMSWVQKQAERMQNLKASAIDFWQDGMALASEEQQQARMNICHACPIFNNGVCDQDRGGCGCNLQLKVKARSAFCPAQKWHAHTDSYTPLVNPTRNLIFHIYPKLGAEWNWHKHIDRIREHQHLFNGKICIAVVTGPGLASHGEVQRLMSGIRVTDWVLRENSRLGETVTMTELLRLVQTDDPNTITLRAHCKGVTHVRAGIEQPWAEMMWQACTDITSVEDALASHEMAGPLKCHEPLVQGKRGKWFFAGSFYWFRNREIFQRQWDYTDRNRWAIEAWPEVVCESKNSACLFFDRMDREILRHWDTIQTEYEFWKASRDLTVPVFVNVFNRLTTTRNLCGQLAAMLNVRVVIVDNASTYQPLLDWYAECPHEVVRLDSNMGHHAPWLSGTVGKIATSGHYCVTDCDLDLEGVPLDLMNVLRAPLVACVNGLCGVKKSGISLRINDLPEWQSEVVNWEQRFWKKPVGGQYYEAIIDTTLCMYSARLPHRHAMTIGGIKTVRTAMPYTARHMPWYLDCENLDEENQQYFGTASLSNSWKPSGKALASRFSK